MPWKISLRRCFRIGEVLVEPRRQGGTEFQGEFVVSRLLFLVYRFLASLRETLFEPRRHGDTKFHEEFSLLPLSLCVNHYANHTIGCVKKLFSIDLIIF
jgi:hypothetical protein